MCRDGENEELRYSLRSLQENAPEGNVWLIGGKPWWYVGNHLYVPQKLSKYANARMSLKALCSDDRIDNNIVLMNDDFFFVKPVDVIEDYHGGLLSDKIDRYETMYPSGSYTRMLDITMRNLNSRGINVPLDYELHIPMNMTRDKLSETIKDKRSLWRSTYGNMYSVGGKQISDVKVYNDTRRIDPYDWKSSDLPYLSTIDSSFDGEIAEMLKEMFPNPSKYESSTYA